MLVNFSKYFAMLHMFRKLVNWIFFFFLFSLFFLLIRIHGFRDSVPVRKLHICCWDMQKLRAKQAILVVAFNAKAVHNSSKRQWHVLNLTFSWNFTFNTTSILFQYYWHSYCDCSRKNESHGWRVSCIWTVNSNQLQDVESHNIKDL